MTTAIPSSDADDLAPAATIQFNDCAAYERYMGAWSQRVGEQFLHWLAPAPGGRWLDVGCGNGAFTELLLQHACAPASVHGIDPSEQQLAYARRRPIGQRARFDQGDAMALPYAADSFDVAVMPLVIFFVPDPAQGVAEMARVVRPGGSIAAYAWDMAGGGFPYAVLQEALRELGLPAPQPPSPEASDLSALQALWAGAGLVEVATRVITVERRYAGFDDWWATVQGGPSVGGRLAALTGEQRTLLQARLRERLPAPQADGSLVCSARAHAVLGRVPG